MRKTNTAYRPLQSQYPTNSRPCRKTCRDTEQRATPHNSKNPLFLHDPNACFHSTAFRNLANADKKYGNIKGKRLLLCANKLDIKDPKTNKTLSFEINIPREFMRNL